MSDETWDLVCGYLVCLNLFSIIVTILKLFGVIGNEIPWLLALAPILFDAFIIIICIVALATMFFYAYVREDIRIKNSKNSHKKRSLK